MHLTELTAPEQRVFGCLIEKRFTTPDQYPLTLNSLRLACNQSTNRDPVTGYDEDTVRDAAQRLCKYGVARLASGHSSRATKYRHLAEESLQLNREQLAVLCVLLLRGPQTPGELKQRTERMAPLGSLDHVESVLAELGERGYAQRLERRPGHKEDRFEQLLGGPGGSSGAAANHPAPVAGQLPSPATASPQSVRADQFEVRAEPARARPVVVDRQPEEGRLDALEARITSLEAEFRQLRELLE